MYWFSGKMAFVFYFSKAHRPAIAVFTTHRVICLVSGRFEIMRGYGTFVCMDEVELHKRLYPEAAEKQEYIICAAIWFKDGSENKHQPKNVDNGFVICGRRHHNCFATAFLLHGKKITAEYNELKGTAVQGFVTSKDRFVDRKEGAAIAYSAGQTDKPETILFSEHLY